MSAFLCFRLEVPDWLNLPAEFARISSSNTPMPKIAYLPAILLLNSTRGQRISTDALGYLLAEVAWAG